MVIIVSTTGLQLYAGSGEGCQWQALSSPVQCEKTATRTRDLPITGDKTLPLAPDTPFKFPTSGNKKIHVGVLASHFPRSELCFGLIIVLLVIKIKVIT